MSGGLIVPGLEAHDEGRACVCISEHRPAPLELERHHIWPLGMGGPDNEWNVAWVCPTAHANTHELMRFLLNGKIVTWQDAMSLYTQPVNRYAWWLATEGIRRWQTFGSIPEMQTLRESPPEGDSSFYLG